jgi:hypothetical protein
MKLNEVFSPSTADAISNLKLATIELFLSFLIFEFVKGANLNDKK